MFNHNPKPDIHAHFDFDEWALLASKDPEAFEQRRIDYIESFIKQHNDSQQRRLRGLQFRIDMERQRARSPMGACIKISNMMWETFAGPEGLVSALNSLTNPAYTNVPIKRFRPSTQTAKILHFNKPN